MTIAKLKEYYLEFYLKSDKSETPQASVLWAFALFAAYASIFLPLLFVPVLLADTFLSDSPVREWVILVSMVLVLLAFMWLFSRPRKWQEEREYEYTADLPDGQVVTLNLRTANGVDYADQAMGDYLLERLAKGLDTWERRKS